MRPNRKNNPTSAFQNGCPSKSRNTSPSSGAGRAANPVSSGSTGSTSSSGRSAAAGAGRSSSSNGGGDPVGRLACFDLEGGLADHPFEARLVEIVDRTIERGEPGDRRDAIRVQHRPVGAADTGDVHERVRGSPLGVAHQLELAEPAVVARLRDGRLARRVGDQRRKLAAQATPVGDDVVDADGLAPAGAEGDVEVLGPTARLCGDRLGVEAQLQDVAGLGLVAGELGVDRLVDERAVGQIDPLEEVGDPSHAVVHERHLEHDVVALGEHVTDPGDPRGERLVAPVPVRHLEDLRDHPPDTSRAPPVRDRAPSASASPPSRRTASAALAEHLRRPRASASGSARSRATP